MESPIYIDYNATAPMLEVVRQKMAEIEGLPLNASSVHALGRKAKQWLESSRSTIAQHISAWPDEVIFTASGTEANNLALKGFPERVVMAAASEHSSVVEIKDRSLTVLPSGLLDLEALEVQLAAHKDSALVSVMLVNNETGIVQPIREISQLVHQYGGLMHCDAVQAIGKLAFDFTTLGVDMLTIAAHKVGGPMGVGALVVKNNVHFAPLLQGGGQEKRRRAGTENIAAIVGFATLIENLPDLSHLLKLRDRIESQILQWQPNAMVAGQGTGRIPNTSNMMIEGFSSELQLMHLDLAGICVSAGSACSSGRIEPSHVLQAMGYSKEQAGCAVRISMGWQTDAAQVDKLLASWEKLLVS